MPPPLCCTWSSWRCSLLVPEHLPYTLAAAAAAVVLLHLDDPKKEREKKKTIQPTTTSNNNRLLSRHSFQSSRYTFTSNWDVHARGRWKGYIKLSACMHDYWANYCSSNWKNMRRCSSINQFIGSRSRVGQFICRIFEKIKQKKESYMSTFNLQTGILLW